MQRLRIRFSRGEDVKYISHLDLIRLWQRALNRAGIPLTYSRGFNPHPQISMALALAMGVTSEAELMDIYVDKFISPHNFTEHWGSNYRMGWLSAGYIIRPSLFLHCNPRYGRRNTPLPSPRIKQKM